LVDLDLVTLPVLIAQSLENVRSRFYSERIPYQVNGRNVVCQSIESVATYERYGADAAEEWRVLDEFLARQPEDVRRAGIAQKRRSKLRSLLVTPVAQMLHNFPVWISLERLRGQYIYRGDHHGFQNLEQCGEVAPRLIAKVAGAYANATSKAGRESYIAPRSRSEDADCDL
jgi:hypothetical protein